MAKGEGVTSRRSVFREGGLIVAGLAAAATSLLVLAPTSPPAADGDRAPADEIIPPAVEINPATDAPPAAVGDLADAMVETEAAIDGPYAALSGLTAEQIERELAARREAVRAALGRRYGGLSAAYSIGIVDREGTWVYQHRSTEPIQAASLYKLAVAAAVYQQVRAGRLSLGERLTITQWSMVESESVYGSADIGGTITVGTAVTMMLILSSNVAARLLMRRIGVARINTLSAELGLRSTRLLGGPFRGIADNAWNQTTARDMGRFFWLLLQGRVVDPAASRSLLAILRRQQIDNQFRAAVPAASPVAHKTGNLPGVVHDAGVVYTPAGPLVVAVLSDGATSLGAARSIIAGVVRTAYDAYSRRPGL